ncbi:MAG: AraC family transcriptional regulator, partial [Paenibacillus sp.]|nr:AraC family transcriptional regulator [Paenibacillus sp.]
MQNYAQQIQLNDLAQMVCLSPSRLTHLFKEQVGRSITDILQKHRLKQAARLLLSTNKSILDICTEVGFNSPAFFTRKFMSFYGTSPGMYRKQNKLEGMKESSLA